MESVSLGSLQSRFKELVEKRDALNSEKIQLDTKISVAEGVLESEYKNLETGFGIKTLEEAEVLLDSMKKDLDAKLSESEKILSECGSKGE